MKVAVLVQYIIAHTEIKSVYLLNQDYSSGHAFANATESLLKADHADVAVVGSEFVPLGAVKDFSPYIAKIAASGADLVATSNWGPDLSLFFKAASESGLKARFIALYAGAPGMPTSLGDSGKGVVTESEWHSNIPSDSWEKMAADYKGRYKQEFFMWRAGIAMNMLASAAKAAGSNSVDAIIPELEKATLSTPTGDVTMREDNHQALVPYIVSELSRGTKFDVEGTGLGWKTLQTIKATDLHLPTTCKMQRP